MSKTILLRGDGNSRIGLGHLYRLSSLHEMLKGSFDCQIITRSSESVIGDVFTQIKPRVNLPVELSLNEEPNWIANQFDPSEHIVVIDGYDFDASYQKELKAKGFVVVYIDDLMSQHMYADLVINHAPSVSAENYSAEAYTRLATGLEYVVLRPEFYDIKKTPDDTEISDVFVCFGGSDFHNLTGKAVEGILMLKEIDRVHVVIGAANQNSSVWKLKNNYPNKVNLYSSLSAKEIINLMKSCQLAIVPSSTISLEACSIPLLIFSGYYVDNQIAIYEGLKKLEVIYAGGDLTTYSANDYYVRLKEIMSDAPRNRSKKLTKLKEVFNSEQPGRILNLFESLIRESSNSC